MSYNSSHDIRPAIRKARIDDIVNNAAVVTYDDGIANLDAIMGKPNPGYSVGRITDLLMATDDTVIVHHFDTDSSAPVDRDNLYVFID